MNEKENNKMVTMYEAMNLIRDLVKEKGHEDTCKDSTILMKGCFAMIEMGEALDLVKKKGIDKMSKEDLDNFLEELIDSIFYILDIWGIIFRDIPEVSLPDTVFMNKLQKNLKRKYYYGRPLNVKEYVPVSC